MACVTLKRPLDHSFEPIQNHTPTHQPPPSKRRRCVPFSQHSRDVFEAPPGLSSSSGASRSVFPELPLSPGDIASHLRDELKRLRKRRQVPSEQHQSGPSHMRPSSPRSPGSPEPMMDDASAVQKAVAALAAMSSPASSPSAAMRDNKQIFTLKQMTMICEKLCKDRTDQVRDEYDKILQQKLSEQYDAFVKFIDHQIQQRFNASQLPSYLS